MCHTSIPAAASYTNEKSAVTRRTIFASSIHTYIKVSNTVILYKFLYFLCGQLNIQVYINILFGYIHVYLCICKVSTGWSTHININISVGNIHI
jgi:hypothetical protein